MCLYLPGRPRALQLPAPDDREQRRLRRRRACASRSIEPTQRLRTTYEGTVLELAEPRAMADPRRAFRESPKQALALDLLHEAVGPLYGQPADKQDERGPAEQSFARAHYEQHMRVTGLARDRGRAPRHRRLRAARPLLGPALLAGDPLLRVADAQLRRGPRRDGLDHPARRGRRAAHGAAACWCAAMRSSAIVDAKIDADYDDERPLPQGARRARRDRRRARSSTIDGEVTGFIPLRNRRDEPRHAHRRGHDALALGDAPATGSPSSCAR